MPANAEMEGMCPVIDGKAAGDVSTWSIVQVNDRRTYETFEARVRYR
jgi:hypothetical protein